MTVWDVDHVTGICVLQLSSPLCCCLVVFIWTGAETKQFHSFNELKTTPGDNVNMVKIGAQRHEDEFNLSWKLSLSEWHTVNIHVGVLQINLSNVETLIGSAAVLWPEEGRAGSNSNVGAKMEAGCSPRPPSSMAVQSLIVVGLCLGSLHLDYLGFDTTLISHSCYLFFYFQECFTGLSASLMSKHLVGLKVQLQIKHAHTKGKAEYQYQRTCRTAAGVCQTLWFSWQ